jgi:hypothetical protein
MTRKDEPVFGNHHAFGKIPERFDHHLARLRKPMIAQFRNGQKRARDGRKPNRGGDDFECVGNRLVTRLSARPA